jgi:DNA-binding transcriptional ArsR family regulator
MCAILKWMLQYLAPHPTVPEPPIDVVFHALSDANRRAMIDSLLDGPASVSELARPLSISLPAVVQHLHVLEASGLVRSHKTGRVRTCEIEPIALGTAERWISERRATWEGRLDRLGEFLAREADETEPSKNRKKTRSKERSK